MLSKSLVPAQSLITLHLKRGREGKVKEVLTIRVHVENSYKNCSVSIFAVSLLSIDVFLPVCTAHLCK